MRHLTMEHEAGCVEDAQSHGVRVLAEVRRERAMELVRLKLTSIVASDSPSTMRRLALKCIDIIVEAK